MNAFGRHLYLIMGTLAVAALFVFGVYLPQTRKLDGLRRQADGLRFELDARATRLGMAKAMHAALVQTRIDAAGFESGVTEGSAIGTFLESVDRIAAETGLTDKDVSPSDAIHVGPISCLAIEVNFNGGFPAVYEFLRRVESLPRVARVQKMEVACVNGSADQLESSVVMHVYFRPT